MLRLFFAQTVGLVTQHHFDCIMTNAQRTWPNCQFRRPFWYYFDLVCHSIVLNHLTCTFCHWAKSLCKISGRVKIKKHETIWNGFETRLKCFMLRTYHFLGISLHPSWWNCQFKMLLETKKHHIIMMRVVYYKYLLTSQATTESAPQATAIMDSNPVPVPMSRTFALFLCPCILLMAILTASQYFLFWNINVQCIFSMNSKVAW